MGSLSFKKKDVQLTDMINSTMELLRDLHIVHEKTAFEELLESKVPGTQITLAQLVNNLFQAIKPVIDLAREMFPALFKVLDWAEEIVRKLLRH